MVAYTRLVMDKCSRYKDHALAEAMDKQEARRCEPLCLRLRRDSESRRLPIVEGEKTEAVMR